MTVISKEFYFAAAENSGNYCNLSFKIAVEISGAQQSRITIALYLSSSNQKQLKTLVQKDSTSLSTKNIPAGSMGWQLYNFVTSGKSKLNFHLSVLENQLDGNYTSLSCSEISSLFVTSRCSSSTDLFEFNKAEYVPVLSTFVNKMPTCRNLCLNKTISSITCGHKQDPHKAESSTTDACATLDHTVPLPQHIPHYFKEDSIVIAPDTANIGRCMGHQASCADKDSEVLPYALLYQLAEDDAMSQQASPQNCTPAEFQGIDVLLQSTTTNTTYIQTLPSAVVTKCCLQ